MKNEIVLVLGVKGTGKTYVTIELLKKLKPRKTYILDPHGEFKSGKIFTRYIDFLNGYRNHKTVIYNPELEGDLHIEKFFDLISVMRKVALVVDDVDMYCSPNRISGNFSATLSF